jgi:hypothetical protein
MAIYAILSFLLGAMLGHRFKVLILAPAIAVAAVVAIAIGIARAEDVWFIGITVVLVTASLQIGYLCGTIIFALLAAAWVARMRGGKFIFKQALSR